MRELDKERLDRWLMAGWANISGAAQDHEHVWKDTKKGLAHLESWLGDQGWLTESYLDRLYMLDKARENFGKAGGLLFAKLAEKLIADRTKKLEGLWRIGAEVADKKGWPYDLVANDRPDPSEETVQAWFDGELHPALEEHYENLLSDHALLRRLYEEKVREELAEIWADRHAGGTLARKLISLPVEGEVALALDGEHVVLVVGEKRYDSGLRRGEFGAVCLDVEICTGKILVTLTLCDMEGGERLCLLGTEAQESLASRAMKRLTRTFDEEIELAELRGDVANEWNQRRTTFIEEYSTLVVHHAECALTLGGILVRGGDWDDPLIGHLIPFGEEGTLFVEHRRLLVRKKGAHWIETPQKTRADAWIPLANSTS